MSFFLRDDVAKSPAMYLLGGLCPSLCRYLTGRPKKVTTQLDQATSPAASTKLQGVGFASSDPAEEHIPEVINRGGPAAKQPVAHRFISPHPLVNFAELSAICGVHPKSAVLDDAVDQKRPLSLGEAVTPSPKSFKLEAESSAARRSSDAPVQAASTSQQPRKDKGKAPVGTSRHTFSASHDIESSKRRNRYSLPISSIDHSRNVSTSSNETLIGSSSGPSSPVASSFAQVLQDAAARIVGHKQADKVRDLEEAARLLRLNLAAQVERADGLQTELTLCKRERETNFNMALWFYRKLGASVLVERSNLIDQVSQLRVEVQERDTVIWSRDQIIQALHLDLNRYASSEMWNQMRQAFYDLQQRYGQMPQDLTDLEQKYRNLEDAHVDTCSKFKKLEGDFVELQVQRDQIKDERDALEQKADQTAESSRQSSREAGAQIWALDVQCKEISDKKAKAEKKARDQQEFLKGLAARIFKRMISLAGILANMDNDPKDDELTALRQLACKHLGFNAAEVANSFSNAGADKHRGIEDKPRQSGAPELQANDVSPSMLMSESNNQQPIFSVPGASNSETTAAGGNDVLESPETFNARRQREVAAAEQALLGPLGLGFEDGSPTLKTKPASEGSKSSKKSRFMGLFPKSTDTPSKIVENAAAGADDIDQVTPGRTGGTRGIARDQWNTAGNDLQDFTKVFKGARVQPIHVVSPDAPRDAEGYEYDPLYSTTPKVEKGNPILNLTNEASSPLQALDSSFGNSSSQVSFVGGGQKPSCLPAQTSEPVSTRAFDFSGPAQTEAATDACAPPRFDFNFGNNNGGVSFTSTQAAPTSAPAPTSEPEHEPATVLSSSYPSSLNDTSSSPAENEQKAVVSTDGIKQQSTEAAVLDPITPSKKNTKADSKPPKPSLPNFSADPNRKQRREGERERKAAEKKAQAAAAAAAAAEKAKKAKKKKQGNPKGSAVTKAMLKERLMNRG